MTRFSKYIWAGLTFSLTLAVLLVGMTIVEAKGKARSVNNMTLIEKNQPWPSAPFFSLDPCSVRECVSL